MDVWQLAIIGGAAWLSVRALVQMTVDHRRQYERRRKREIAREAARAVEAAALESAPRDSASDETTGEHEAARNAETSGTAA